MVLGAGVWYWYTGGSFTNPFKRAVVEVEQPTTVNTVVEKEEAASSQNNTGLSTEVSDVSDGALSRDIATLDAEVSALNADTSQMDQSITDKPVKQDY